MKKLTLLFICFSLSLTAFARPNPACEDFKKIHKLLKNATPENVRYILPHADWLDNQYRRRDQQQAASIVVKTVVLALAGLLSPFTYAFEPSHLGNGTFTGMYASNPENFATFLSLKPQQACFYLNMDDSSAALLRQQTRDVWVYLDRARR